MSKNVKPYQRFQGIADFPREGAQDTYAFGRSVDYRTDPQKLTLLPRTIKESGNVITDLPKWGEIVNGSVYMYGNVGNLYQRNTAGSYSFLRAVANSHGNGLVYSKEDDFLYYTLDKVIGRYGPLSSANPTFVDDFFGSQGGVPLNTNSLDLESSSSQYADRADTASLSITGNLAIDLQVKPESLPTVGNTMTLVSKWNGSGNIRSYKFDIATVSGYFGDASNGTLTISGNTTDAPIDSACTGTIATTSLSATNASFASGQIILIHQSQGTNAGTWQRNTISSYTAGTITTVDALNATYTTGAQVLVMKQYDNVTIDAGVTYTAKAWNGTVGGILAFIASGTVTVTGTISANGGNASSGTGATGGGFRGGNGGTSAGSSTGFAGEGISGTGGAQTAANGNGGGGGNTAGAGNAAGAGGGNGTAGSNGQSTSSQTGGTGGAVAGTTDLTTMVFGGGGGGGAGAGPIPGGGGSGGGIVFLTGTTMTITGSVTASGGTGYQGGASEDGGSGAGGSVLLKAQTATLGTALITASGGVAGVGEGGDGGAGRVHLDYYTSYTGTTTPTIDATQDNTLVTNTTYQLRLAISSNGTAFETLTRPIPALVTDVWQQLGVSWLASTSTATFYFNATSLGTATGALTSISDNASRFAVGSNFSDAGSATNFYDGLIDEVRVFNMTRSQSDFFNGLSSQILVTTAGLVAYYKFNGDYNDATANANTLTGQNSPVFTVDVPYPSPTTRLDIDQSATTSGNTYTTPTAINENATNRKTVTPAKDPQKGVAFLIASKGSGDWTVTVHDQFNNVIATETVTNANLSTGYYEFVFDPVWRPLTNFTNEYHFHITSTVGDGTVTTTTSSDLETVSFRTYYQFLVEQSEWHPGARMLNFLVFGNERYVAKYEAPLYFPNQLVLPAGYIVRCFAYWREYLAIGVQQGANIYDNDIGRIYFWDGIAPTFNFFIDVPEGGINAMYGSKGNLFVWAGYQGNMLVYKGGDSAEKIKQVPKVTTDKYMEVYPGAVNMWKTLLRFGVAGNGDSTVIEKGAYTYGSTNSRYEDSLSYDYPISTGTLTGTTTKIGMLVTINKKLLIGWQDNTAYGVDYVDDANAVYPTGTVEFLIQDDEAQWKEKELVQVAANYNPLIAGQTVSIKYKINDASSWTYPDVVTENDSVGRSIIPDGRYNETQVGVDLATTVSTSPALLSLAIERELNEKEGRVG